MSKNKTSKPRVPTPGPKSSKHPRTTEQSVQSQTTGQSVIIPKDELYLQTADYVDETCNAFQSDRDYDKFPGKLSSYFTQIKDAYAAVQSATSSGDPAQVASIIRPLSDQLSRLSKTFSYVHDLPSSTVLPDKQATRLRVDDRTHQKPGKSRGKSGVPKATSNCASDSEWSAKGDYREPKKLTHRKQTASSSPSTAYDSKVSKYDNTEQGTGGRTAYNSEDSRSGSRPSKHASRGGGIRHGTQSSEKINTTKSNKPSQRSKVQFDDKGTESSTNGSGYYEGSTYSDYDDDY
ncbi:MAG: hypothetical protein TREMPRED_001760 [Tremellales sp. Tagirdzhanova-0007]|nr:MAG: hypothetical protein TREMPRED_001760 [Tremellales sp. Tagirdzhanova-0007]